MNRKQAKYRTVITLAAIAMICLSPAAVRAQKKAGGVVMMGNDVTILVTATPHHDGTRARPTSFSRVTSPSLRINVNKPSCP